MEFVVDIITIVLIILITETITAHWYPKWQFDDQKERQEAVDNRTVFFSRRMTTVLSILAGILVVFALIVCFFPDLPQSMGFDPVVTLAFLCIPMLLALSTIIVLLPQIRYNEETFTYRNSFGVTKIYRYEMITAIFQTNRKITITANGKTMVMPIGFCGAREFSSFAISKTRL